MVQLIVNSDRDNLIGFGRNIPCSCLVRTLANGEREYNQIVYSLNADGSMGSPCMPLKFPYGTWTIGEPRPKDDPYMSPFFIPTDAHCKIEEWSLIQYEGVMYGKALGTFVDDWGFGLHYSTSRTTLGCLKILSKDDLLYLVSSINDAHKGGEIVQLVVGG